MKNLLNRYTVEEIEDSFIENLGKKVITCSYHYDDIYRKWRREHIIDGESIYRILHRVLENNIGKSFDQAFSYFCKKVPKRYQKKFLREFEYIDPYYIIDEDGNIQNNDWYNKKPDTKISIKSEDYKVELFHKHTGHNIDWFEEVQETEKIEYKIRGKVYYTTTKKGPILYYIFVGKGGFWNRQPAWKSYIAYKKDFIPKIVKGWEKTFDSKDDPEYKKLISELSKKKKKIKKQKQLEIQEREYIMLSKKRIRTSKKKKEVNNNTILAQGFDLKTSFRGVQKPYISN